MKDAQLSLSLMRTMMLIRLFESTISDLAAKKALPGWLHLSIGQEAVAAGTCSVLRSQDWVISGHRAHGHALAKGMSARSLAAELYGKATGCCKGMGGSMHLVDIKNHILTTSFVGQGYNLAAGLGLSSQIQGKESVVVAFGGDGSTNTGAFHESLNLAAVWQLPVVFVIENNGYAVSTKFSKSSPVEKISSRASSYGIPGVTVNGNDAWEVHDTVYNLVGHAREGKGPALVECITYRQHGHYEGEQWEMYRSAKELTEWSSKDPIEIGKRKLLDSGITKGDLESIELEAKETVDDAISFASNSPNPSPEQLRSYVLY